MRFTHNGKKFDTDRADLVAEYESPYYRTDCHWWQDGLYVTSRGTWFLAGIGNAFSKYASGPMDFRGPGAKIFPLTQDEAITWLAETGNYDALDVYFPELEYA